MYVHRPQFNRSFYAASLADPEKFLPSYTADHSSQNREFDLCIYTLWTANTVSPTVILISAAFCFEDIWPI